MFVFRGWDKKDHLDVRKAHRDDHIQWLNSLGEALKLAGPTLDEDGNMNGSVLIVDYESKELFLDRLKNDPYAKADLFEKTEVSSFVAAIEKFSNLYKID